MSGSSSVVAPQVADGPLRAVRSTAVALVCTITAALGHAAGDGTLAPLAVVLSFAGAWAVSWSLAGRRLTPGQMVGMLVLCQVAVHLAGSTAEMTMSVAMVAGHLAATAFSAMVLARGEAFVWGLAERLGLRVTPSGLTVAVIPSWRPLVPVVAPRSLHDVRLAHSRAERGPPDGS